MSGTACLACPPSYIQYQSCRAGFDADPDAAHPEVKETRYDCTANDGVPGENDCVGEDIENIVGTPFDDGLIGNDADPLYGQGPGSSPRARTSSRSPAATT